jgi:hypothetical protein
MSAPRNLRNSDIVQTRSKSKGISLPANRTIKKKKVKKKKDEEDIPYHPATVNGVTVDDLAATSLSYVSVEAVDDLLSIVPNKAEGMASLYLVLSQILYGNTDHHQTIREEVCASVKALKATTAAKKKLQASLKKTPKDRRCFMDDGKIYLMAASILYRIHLLLCIKHTPGDQYTLVHMMNGTAAGQQIFSLRYDEATNHYDMLVERIQRKAAQVEVLAPRPGPAPGPAQRKEREFKIERILAHSPRSFQRPAAVDFLVKWKGYDASENLWLPWKEVVRAPPFHLYIKNLDKDPTKASYIKRAQQAVEKWRKTGNVDGEEEHAAAADDDEVPAAVGARKRKNNTGRKVSVIGDMLELKGKGGIYSVLPYEQIDDKNKAIFKVGMTTDYTKRMDQMHLYFPNGVYFIALLSDPTLPEWEKKKVQRWKDNHKGEPPTDKDKKSEFYKVIEKFVFKHIEIHKGKRIHATTRVRNPDELQRGETEWIYTHEDVIHEAFNEAHLKFPGGRLQHFYLSGLDPDTGQLVQSINDLAKEHQSDVPNYTGKVIFKL